MERQEGGEAEKEGGGGGGNWLGDRWECKKTMNVPLEQVKG